MFVDQFKREDFILLPIRRKEENLSSSVKLLRIKNLQSNINITENRCISFGFPVNFIENIIKLCGAAAYFSSYDLLHVHIYTNRVENGFYSKGVNE